MSTIKSSTTSTTAYSVEADTTGALVIQTGATPTTALTISSAQVVTLAQVLPEASGGTGTTVGYNGFKNRIINGAMVIDQRNAGASVTATTANLYTLDRWQTLANVSSKYTVQQNAGNLTGTNLPTGFNNYLGVTSSAATSVGASDYYSLLYKIEGYNASDFGFGVAGAATVTLSFWVRSSLTGTFGGALGNSAGDRSYPFTYTISSANTWEQKTVTIAGDTSGTWLKTNGIGITLFFGLGVGSTLSGTAGSWSANNYFSATGATSVVGTNGATFYITGVQLEKGSTATSFDYRPYTTEQSLCYRYFVKETGFNTRIASRYGASLVYLSYTTPVEMRTTPTVANSGTNWQVLNTTASENSTTSTVNTVLGYVGGNVDVVLNTSFNPAAYIYIATSSATANSLTFSAEL